MCSIVLCLYVLLYQLLIVVIDINVYCYCRNQFSFLSKSICVLVDFQFPFLSRSTFCSCRFPIYVLVDFQFPFLSKTVFQQFTDFNSLLQIVYLDMAYPGLPQKVTPMVTFVEVLVRVLCAGEKMMIFLQVL